MGQLGYAGLNGGIFGNRGVDQHRITHGLGYVAIIVEGQVQFAEVFAIGVGLDDCDAVHHVRVRTSRPVGGVGQQRVGMPTHDHVQTGGVDRDGQVGGIARMAEQDNLVDAIGHQLVNLGLDGRRRVGENNVRPRAGQFIIVNGGDPNQADLFASLVHNNRFLDHLAQRRFPTEVGVGHQHWELRQFYEFQQRCRPVVKFVITDRHGIIVEVVHELGCGLALVVLVEQRALKLVTRVHQQPVVSPRLSLLDGSDHTGHAAKAFAFVIVLGLTAAVVFVDRLKPVVEIVRVQNGQFVLG